MYGTPQRRGQNFSWAAGIPATTVLIAANVLTFLISFFAGREAWMGGGPFRWFVFTNATWPEYFWTIVTWPLVASVELISLLFGCLWAYWIAGSLERSWGTRAFLTFLALTSALTALTLWAGGLLLGVPFLAQGIWLAIAAPTIAWCVLNAREVIRLYAVIPIPAPILAWLTVALTWFDISRMSGHPLMGAFALSGCAAAYWYAKHGRYAYQGYARSSGGSGVFGGLRGGEDTRGSAPRSEGTTLRFRDFDREAVSRPSLNPFKWYQAYKQRRALEKMWKRSGFSDPEERNNRR